MAFQGQQPFYRHAGNVHDQDYSDTPAPPPPRHAVPSQSYQYDPAYDLQREYNGSRNPEQLPLNSRASPPNTAYEPVSPIGYQDNSYHPQTNPSVSPVGEFSNPYFAGGAVPQQARTNLPAAYTTRPPSFQQSRGAPSVRSQSTSRSAYPTSQPTNYPPPVFPSSASQASSSDHTLPTLGQHYTDNPYKRVSTTWDPTITQLSDMELSLNPKDVASDDEDDTFYNPKSRKAVPTVSGIMGSNTSYDPLANPNFGDKSGPQWERTQEAKSRKTRKMWIIGILIVLVLAIAGGTAAGVILTKKAQPPTTDKTSTTDAPDAPGAAPLTGDSGAIQSLLNNPKLHKSFYGMDYTPLNAAQYPECLTVPATQNNVTKDIAVMSQLTDTIRLYGNDCNQTELILEAIKILNVDMKVWLGVWLDNNVTTGDRQLSHMYDILSTYGVDLVAGVIIGNENIFRQEITVTELAATIKEVKTNLTSLNYDLKVATAQLGSDWSVELAEAVDVLMANVHPFFAGVTVDAAANWTASFFKTWDENVAAQVTPTAPESIISEVGWPSQGGHLNGSVAGIDEMNTFLSEFICSSNTNGTSYFWFSIFDEPWKIIYDNGTENWEDHWGLMDIDRNLKNGLTLPDCPITSTK